MKLSEHKELKKEILALPVKEKDKLLLRLVAKDKVLTEHLHFLLLEDGFKIVLSGVSENPVNNLETMLFVIAVSTLATVLPSFFLLIIRV